MRLTSRLKVNGNLVRQMRGPTGASSMVDRSKLTCTSNKLACSSTLFLIAHAELCRGRRKA
eukprot:1160138-Pelagomonas_calceolata.AAC.6